MNGPRLWTNILNQIPGNKVIAGGCIRDWMLGVPEKDIDVFYNGTGTNDFVLDADWRLAEDQVQPDENRQYEGMNQIIGISDLIYQDHRVQLIRLDDAVDLGTYITNFDISICKGNFRSFEGLMIPGPMARDLEAKHIFCEGQINQTSVRANRFLEKISQFEQGWRVINDPGNNNFFFADDPDNPFPR